MKIGTQSTIHEKMHQIKGTLDNHSKLYNWDSKRFNKNKQQLFTMWLVQRRSGNILPRPIDVWYFGIANTFLLGDLKDKQKLCKLYKLWHIQSDGNGTWNRYNINT